MRLEDGESEHKWSREWMGQILLFVLLKGKTRIPTSTRLRTSVYYDLNTVYDILNIKLTQLY